MEHISEILEIIDAGLRGEKQKLINYSQFLAEKLEKEGQKELSNIITKTVARNLNSSNMQPRDLIVPKSLVDSESNLPLAEMKSYNLNDVDMVLNDDSSQYVEEFITLINKKDKLLEENIRAYKTLLLYGPPGTGKSQTAKYISAKTNLPLLTFRIEGVISSYLGSTSKNIKNLFDFVKNTPCILFLDEFDAIAKARDDVNELGELKRVVNTLLQNIDDIKGKVPIIAATNHEKILDSAVWRRFDYKLFLGLPGIEQRNLLIKSFLGDNLVQDKMIKILSYLAENMSGADIEILIESIKTHIAINSIKVITDKSLFDLFIKYKYSTTEKDDRHKIEILEQARKENRKLFDYSTLSKLLGLSVGTVFNKINKRHGTKLITKSTN
jgi:SpoVK/Ycf46/Vps4 family AAA+-type ATPase